MSIPILETRELFYSYPDGTPALKGVSIKLHDGERLALIGANGSGKSTLLMLIAGCLKPDKGEILLDGSSVNDFGPLRDAAGLVFQEPDDQLFMPSVLEDVAFGLVARKTDHAAAQTKAMSLLERLGASRLKDRAPHRMSGGEKRMAALAGILVLEPRIILLDEPTSSLDPKARRDTAEVLEKLGTPMIISTHDLSLAKHVCGKAIIMQDGRIRAEGPPQEILESAEKLRRYGL